MDDMANSIPDEVRSLLIVLLLVIYAIWLLAGMVDYLCHRWMDIGGTSGSTESWLHVAQFVALGVALLQPAATSRHWNSTPTDFLMCCRSSRRVWSPW